MASPSWSGRAALAAAGIALSSVLAACGSSPSSNGVASKTASQIYTAAKAATASASSVHYTGQILNGGKTITLDIVAAGSRGGGTITVQGAKLDIVAAANSVYLKADAASWSKLGAPAATAQLVNNKWLQSSTSDPNFGSFASFTNLSKLVSSLSAKHAPTKGTTTTVNGQSAITIIDKQNGTLYVATTGKPYILEIMSTKTGNSGKIIFSDYGNATAPAIPSHAININALTGGG